MPFPSLGDLPNPGIKPKSCTLWADSLPSEPPRKPKGVGTIKTNQCIEPCPVPSNVLMLTHLHDLGTHSPFCKVREQRLQIPKYTTKQDSNSDHAVSKPGSRGASTSFVGEETEARVVMPLTSPAASQQKGDFLFILRGTPLCSQASSVPLLPKAWKIVHFVNFPWVNGPTAQPSTIYQLPW